MIDIPVDEVRNILGKWANDLTDGQISADSIAVMVEADIASACPTWSSITAPDTDKLEMAIAYLAAGRLVSNIGGVRTITLGDQSITMNQDFIAKEQSRWKREAFALIGAICPVDPVAMPFGIHFGKASGRRG